MDAVLAAYAARGTFERVPTAEVTEPVTAFRWFRGIEFRLRARHRARRLCLEGALAAVPSRSPLDRALRVWLAGRHDTSLPPHRRIDPACMQVGWRNRGGRMDLEARVLDADWGSATRRLIHLLNELYLDVLARPAHHEWLVETFDLDPDNPRWP
jgi:hypothetical protein